MEWIYADNTHWRVPGKVGNFFMSMIDVNPGDLSCIFSTLHFISAQAKQYNVTPVVTFDQPLYWKAQTIITSEPPNSDIRNIVVSLGAFHLFMSFLGSIGHLMAGSGLQEAIETVYAANSAVHIIAGKAYSRAIRAHFLVEAALSAIFVSTAFNMPWLLLHPDSLSNDNNPGKENSDCQEEESLLHNPADLDMTESVGNDELDEAAALFESLMQGKTTARDAAIQPVLGRIKAKLDDFKRQCSSRTSKLWIQYQEMVHLLRTAIKAERTGDFKLHLSAVAKMLPYFAASGHNLYTKSARLYLQQMMELNKTHPSDVTLMAAAGRGYVSAVQFYNELISYITCN